ncbi:4-hydroxybenzoyl-CoA thioesterase [Marisediminicola antarctica]|uniref:4-hydroxybenzoyl-CoA thioesterase n=2 Tax=Marisediminicola antarctica TaxID=674079 RepID=A0A7L5AP33_9MICO|nr:4-hydroxybenzoyl-CoA thioesterase [Marisediminicola antarctica]
MHMIFRTLLVWLRRHRGPKLGIHEVGRLRLRVVPTDLDVLGHMNNGVYLSIMDLGRMDAMQRSGAWTAISAAGFYPVAASETISFRRSLQPWQRFVLETRIVGYDQRAVYIEQRFVVGGELYATGFVRAKFLKRTGGTVTVTELASVTGADPSEVNLPEWLARWAADVAMPPSRVSAASEWP